ncbi:hypothetical protein Cpir12675_001730 [Ceratocystis pirilliformis]|uniref:Uncharacterized protein n=1 Tax=Ceratocystis pirilliformis TaxID=259994 RepID=A0ABR3ZEQ5_9PEZI
MVATVANWVDAFRIDRYLQRTIDFSAYTWDTLTQIEPSSEALVQTHTLLTARTSRAGNAPTRSLSHISGPNSTSAPKFSSTPLATGSKVARLCVYPVIPCNGIEIAKSKIVRRGMQYNAIYAFIKQAPNTKMWDLLLPTECPNLGRLFVEIWIPDIIKTRGSLDKAPNEAFVLISFPWVDRGWQGLLALLLAKITKGFRGQPDKEAILPVEFPTQREIQNVGYQYEEVNMGERVVKLLNMGRELPEEIAMFLGVNGKLGLARIDRYLDGENGTREIRSLCMLPEKLDEDSTDWVIRRPNITVSQTLPGSGQYISKISFDQGDAMFSSDWSYDVSRYSDGALHIVPQPSEEPGRSTDSWLEVGMGIVVG